ncbi:thiol reductant ABC exporter subunit CydD [Desertivibrio insolitus]|uniref:thiol reductant ABC exporter subunit CydD n=1 Tax=Herbiconiux sp. SYSU D00978 TaxID=2812562 RepID=UPI0027DB3C76|nr:thiol reductant ABC exporter subunit CydD [Herbiconiux sp. SYSU D00978]
MTSTERPRAARGRRIEAPSRRAAAARGPLAPLLALGPRGIRSLYVLGLLGALKGGALVALAWSLAVAIARLVEGGDGWAAAIGVGIVAAVARGALAWATEAYAARAALGAKEHLRGALAERLLAGPSSLGPGGASVLASRGLDELDTYYSRVLPAIAQVATVPLVVGARILLADWVSALIVVLTVPLVPVFMALVGLHTRDRVEESTSALTRLSDHLVELARGLPVLVGLGRVEEQTAALRDISDEHRRRTLATLRHAFLSSLVLELIATISVAVVAVFVGLRLLGGDLPLEVGLLALLLAPECFTPFRDVGGAFHAAQDAVAASSRVRAAIDEPVPAPLSAAPAAAASAAPVALEVRGLAVRYPGRGVAAVEGLDLTAPAGAITVLDGPSGSGKSTVLAVLDGSLGGEVVTGELRGVDRERMAVVPQHPKTVAPTVREELALYGPGGDALLARLGLAARADADPAELSPGELRRLAVARALARVEAGATLVLLDEPTAHLDDRSARAVERELAALAGRATVLLVSHEPRVRALATSRVLLGAAAPDAAEWGALPEPAPADALPAVEPVPATDSDQSGLALIARFLRPAAWRFVAAALLGSAAATAAAALTAVSGWLIVRASQEPAIMYLLVAIVGVRFFGIARAVLRYCERLVTHDAVFDAATGLRMRLWRGLAQRGASSRALLRGGSAVDLLVVTADSARDLVPRVVLPPVVALVTSTAAVATVALLHAPAVPLLVAALLIALVGGPLLARWADRRASRGRVALRGEIARRVAALAAAADDLRSNGVTASVRRGLREADAAAGADARRAASALGAGSGLVVAVLCAAAVAMPLVLAPAVRSGALDLSIAAVLVLLPLGLLEPVLGGVDAVQQYPALRSALSAVAVAEPETPAAPAQEAALAPQAVETLELDDAAARWPGAPVPAFAGLTATARRGRWLVVHGPSGSGKSTLLTVLLGYLPLERGRYLLGGVDAAGLAPQALRSRVAWAPQEGYLFDSTIRGNLLLARSRDDRPDEQELHRVLTLVGLGPLVATLPRGLDTRIGSEGAGLSGGERQRLAVARTLLTRAEVVLLDEPTAHLDLLTAAALMADLRTALADKIVVLVTHRAADVRPGDALLALAPDASAPALQAA